MKLITKTVTLMLIAASSTSLLGQDWSGEGEFGYVSNDTEAASNDTVTLKAKLGRETERWRHTARAEGIYAESETEEVTSKTADKFFASWKSDRKLWEKHYIYGLISYETDTVNDLDYRINESLGYGRRVLRGPSHLLDAEIGVGARQTSINEVTEDEAVLRLAADYRYNFNERAHFTEELSIEHGAESTVSRSITGLSTKIQDNLASKVSYTHQLVDTDGDTKNESTLAVTLVYSF